MTKFKETVGFLWDVLKFFWDWLAYGVVQKNPQVSLAVIVGLLAWMVLR